LCLQFKNRCTKSAVGNEQEEAMSDDEMKIPARVLPRQERLPSHDRFYIVSSKKLLTEADDEKDNDIDVDNERNVKCTNFTFSALHILSHLLQLCTLILSSLGQMIFKKVPKDDQQIAQGIVFTVAFCLAALNVFVLNPILYKYKKTRTSFKTADIILFVLFGILLIIVWAFPNELDYVGVIIFGVLLLSYAISWFIGHPTAKQNVADEVDPIALTHPLIIMLIRIQTVFSIVVYTILMILFIPLFKIPNALTTVILIAAGIISAIIPRYFWSHIEKIAGRYEKEIDEWMQQHPTNNDDEFIKMSDQQEVKEWDECDPKGDTGGGKNKMKMLVFQEEIIAF